MAWIESHQELARHPKTRRLARLLGEPVVAIIGRLHCLWWWALDYADDGDLRRFGADDIADACQWENDPDLFVESVISAGFLDQGADGLQIHDWDNYAGRLVEKRRASVERVKRWRAQQETTTNTPETPAQAATNGLVTRNERVGYSATVPNRTGPDLRVPDPTGETTTAVVVVAPNGAATATAALSDEARDALDSWRAAHGKRRPPKLNPILTRKLNDAVADLGLARLQESAEWSARKGIPEVDKWINAAYTKRQQDEAATMPQPVKPYEDPSEAKRRALNARYHATMGHRP